MCGITGLFQFGEGQVPPIEAALIDRMRDTMVTRGPDGAGTWISPDHRVGLGHRRLAIIDLSARAAQPMCNEDGSVWIVFNGEIYNHPKLRAELVQAGHRFKTDHSDTEVLVHGYEEWSLAGLVERLEGMFAFAIWDAARQRLSLVRDRVGVKPLYLSLRGDSLLFGSEIKAILEHPAVERDIEPIAMYHYLSFMTTPAPLTMFRGIYKLPAGFFMTVEVGGKVEARRYWDALPGRGIEPGRIANLSAQAREEFYVEEIRRLLDEAVDKRLMSDVPFGVLLSGGIDSSLNVALMSRHMTRPVDTFTIGFSDHSHLNELQHANRIAREFRTNHHEVLIAEPDMVGYLDNLVHHQDEPIADWVCIPLYFVSKLVRDSGTVVVQVGEGSDEQFCGYRGYMAHLEMHRRAWKPFRRYVPVGARRAIGQAAAFVASYDPRLAMYADIIERAAADRELFWSGAHVFPRTLKDRLIPGRLPRSLVRSELVDSGLLPLSYLDQDSFQVVQSFMSRIDREAAGADVLTRMIYSEFKLRLPELLLMRVDKITMSTSIEARVPFLDHHMVEFTMDIPMEDKIRGGTAKHLLKKAAEGIIPHEIIYRKKMGFGAPMVEWMRGPFGALVADTIRKSRLRERGFFDQTLIDRMITDHRSGKRDYAVYVWTLFNLTVWYDYWIDHARPARRPEGSHQERVHFADSSAEMA
jgi:asparagine synthase (glutamine-hydrolysing)